MQSSPYISPIKSFAYFFNIKEKRSTKTINNYFLNRTPTVDIYTPVHPPHVTNIRLRMTSFSECRCQHNHQISYNFILLYKRF